MNHLQAHDFSREKMTEVHKITTRKEEFTGSFTDFERTGIDILQGIEGKEVKEILLDIASYSRSTDKKLEKGVLILGDIKKDTSTMLEKQDSMLEKQDMMMEKQDKALEKQDTMLSNQSKMLDKQDFMLGNQAKMLDKQDTTITTIREESQITRDVISSEFRTLEKRLNTH
ncbi:MAG: hypothetical protein ACLFVX_10750 [Archaeoglobaceae archaeon]